MTKLQELRIKQNLSQAELARISGVNYRTLQDFDQGRKSLSNAKGDMLYKLSIALGCSMAELLPEYISTHPDQDTSALKQTSRLMKYAERLSLNSHHYYGYYYTFPVLEERTGVRMEYIYPTKQKLVCRIHDILSPRNEIVSVMLFGSSISMRCTADSDTDLSIRLRDGDNTTAIRDEISESVQEVCDWNADIIWFDRITPDDRVYHDICRGVQIV